MTRVEGTNDYSIVSKLSAANKGYFEDDFLQAFVEKPRGRAPLINWGYYIRSKSLELSFEKAVQFYASRNQEFQVLSIGAGFDSTYFNVAKKYHSSKLTFFEIDLPSNVQRKIKLIMNSSKCNGFVASPVISDTSLICDKYKLFACDLANSDELKKCLIKFKFYFSLPTLVLSECVITYMKEHDSTTLIRFLSEELDNTAFFVYEQCRPVDGFGAFMVQHFSKIGSPIHGILRYATPEEQVDRYLNSAWQKSKIYTLSEVYFSLPDEERQRIRSIEQFDEFEEFFLKCSHYFVLVATKGECNIIHGTGDIKQLHLPTIYPEEEPLVLRKVEASQQFQRFGHTLCTTSKGIFLYGGFGTEDNSHKRLGTALRFSFQDGNIVDIREFKEKHFERLYSGGVFWEGKILIFGGRLNPNRGLQELLEIDVEAGVSNLSTHSLPDVRWRHATLLVGDHLVVIGGKDKDKVYDDVIALNLKTGKVISRKLSGPLLSCSAVLWGEKIIVSGGSLNLAEDKETLWILQIVDDEITAKKVCLEMDPRFGHTSHVVGNHLLLVGGVGLRGSSGIDSVNLITGEIRRKLLPNFNSQNETKDILMLHNHTSFVKDGKLIIVGGGGNCFSFGTHINSTWQIDLRLNFPFI